MYFRLPSIARPRLLFMVVLLLLASVVRAEKLKDWTSVIRESPYWESQGVYNNILSIRRWIIEENGYCSEAERHILFDRRGRFLGYMENAETREATQHRLNKTRQSMAEDGRADYWVAGAPDATGYPFALACDQPHVNLDEALGRYVGRQSSGLIWGAWDDLDLGTREKPVSLNAALGYVYTTRYEQRRLDDVPEDMPRFLAGQLLIESGGQQRAHSAANARGIMQLSSVVLGDCGIGPRNYWHRLAQLDCALSLTAQNARNLRPAFDARFGHLPKEKRDRLFTLLLVQAYHGGAARVQTLLEDDDLAQPAAYFAANHARFSAGDMAYGLIFHNLGRNRLGLSSLYYVADVELAAAALCRLPQMEGDPVCVD
ncbi:hypothetical protein RE428_03040 [Marinobacter nanhaiticus D15-8W]|uniref:hypothetical protein n=1 Tax=Marinobacter nanhaiticus TaxID=1305740 RepID=UPI00059247B4|nr:hypothetical protein [Marinobacter nanhaiticus]BES69286.1 hypothetical protein RE428_03040 [Marinobacter nanhaiticus D15-8W]